MATFEQLFGLSVYFTLADIQPSFYQGAPIGLPAPGQPGASAAIILAPRLPGAWVRDPMAAPSPLRVTALKRSDPTAIGVVLDQGKDYRWSDQLNEAGAASLVLANDDPDLAGINWDDLILFEVQGYAAFTMMVREMNHVAVTADEERGQLTSISGPGSLALLEGAVVYPSRGVGVWPIEEDRVFSWPAPDYLDWWWEPATVIAPDIATMSAAYASYGVTDEMAIDFPDPTAMTIWGTGAWIGGAPDGDVYLRATIDIPIDATYRISWLLDNWGDLYLDGAQISQTTGKETWHQAVKEDVHLSAGQHTIAVRCVNWPSPGEHNIGAFTFALNVLHSDGSLGEVVAHSDASWRALSYPAEPPGMTPGEAMEHCFAEARNRGQLSGLDWTFNAAVDSAGQPWPIVGDIATKVGTDLLTFVKELSNTYIDLAISPAGFTVYAWIRGGRGEDREVSLHRPTDRRDPGTGNLGKLTHKRQRPAARKFLVRWAGGWNQVPDTSWDSPEATLALGAQQSHSEITRIASAELANVADVRSEISAEIIPTGTGDCPVLDFGVGDTIVVPDWDGTPVRVRVLSIGGNLDENGRLSWAVELKDRLLDERERAEQAMKKMDNGTLRGTSKVATPAGLIGKRNIPPRSFGGA